MRSVSQRLLVSITLLLLLFFGVMIAVLDARFRSLAERSLRELLDVQMVALISSAEIDQSGRFVPRLPDEETRMAVPGSGLYAAVRDDQETFWRSPSAVGSVMDFGPPQPQGARAFRYITDVRGQRLATVSRGISWEDKSVLTFIVATELTSYDAQISRFRKGLLGGFTIVAVLLLVALAIMLRWAVGPLRRLEAQIRAVERGERERLDGNWPTELHGLVANLNALLTAERRRIARYRDTLGNLAHSLKTPLAVLRASFAPGAAGDGTPVARVVGEQVERMSAIVAHQLRRSVTGGGATVGQQAVEILPVAQELRRALLKAHGRKDFALQLDIAPELLFVGDRDDLTEALGNLMDNAVKWCAAQVRVVALLQPDAGAVARLQLAVEDDGPGIPVSDRERVLDRGVRADERTPGHGLGLAMVREMTGLYGGELRVGESALGGARVELRLPGRLK